MAFCLYIFTGNDVADYSITVDSNSHKRGRFGSCSDHDFSITIQPILKKLTVLESLIQGLHFLLCNWTFLLRPPKMGLMWTYRRLRIT